MKVAVPYSYIWVLFHVWYFDAKGSHRVVANTACIPNYVPALNQAPNEGLAYPRFTFLFKHIIFKFKVQVPLSLSWFRALPFLNFIALGTLIVSK